MCKTILCMRNSLPLNMMKCKYSLWLTISVFCLAFSLVNFDANAQVAINEGANDPHPNSILDVSSSTKGILIPRLTNSQRNAINPAANANGLMIYNTDANKFNYWDGTRWNDVGTGSGGFVPMWYFGSENPPTDVPTTGVSYLGVPGDYYINNTTGKLFIKGSDNVWNTEKTSDTSEEIKFRSSLKSTIAANSIIATSLGTKVDFNVPNAKLDHVVSISPQHELPDGVVISYARVKAIGVIEVRFNTTIGASVNIPAGNYNIALIIN